MSTYEVTASLVDTTMPELGPVASRTVHVAAAPGGIAGAVSTALGFMRVQAVQNDLTVAGAAVVCENSLQREIVADALADTEPEPVLVVDIFDSHLIDAYPPDVAAALLVGQVDIVAPQRAALPKPERRGIWPVAAVAALVLAALGAVTAWAMTSSPAGDRTVPVEVVHPTQVVPSTAIPVEVAIPTPAPEATAPPTTEAPLPLPPAPETVDVIVPEPAVVVPTQTQQPRPTTSVPTTTRTTQPPETGTTTVPSTSVASTTAETSTTSPDETETS
ncbi:hypothetical protein [Rhodococcoides kyotonense]|uniref:hypothetical protein n=1 Tax=Rhodococcoides kyotonense TaxID=398843 RepID=UPI001FE2D138|nr:hypothetical protein [Rhodococcus kyotonensis]